MAGPGHAEGAAASKQQNVVRDNLQRHLGGIVRDALSGSYARRTAIRPLHDIDLFVVLDPATHRDVYPSTTVLPSASFTGLWKFVVPGALKCDPDLAVIAANPRSKQRMETERRNANATLARAWALIDPNLSLDKRDQLDRSAQLANAALDAGDPDTFDFALLTKVMSQLRDRAPALALGPGEAAVDDVVGEQVAHLEDVVLGAGVGVVGERFEGFGAGHVALVVRALDERGAAFRPARVRRARSSAGRRRTRPRCPWPRGRTTGAPPGD